MVTKIISLSLAICALELIIVGLQTPNDAIYLIISNNPFVVAIRFLLILVLAAIALAFKDRFKYRLSRPIVTYLGFLLLFFGATGMISQTLIDEFGVIIKYLDFWVIFLLGIVFTISALSYEAGRRDLRLQTVIASRLPKPSVDKIGETARLNLRSIKKSRA